MTPPASLRTWAGSQRAGPPPPTLAEGQGGDDTNQKTFQFVLQSGNSKEKNRQALHKVRSHISRTRPKQKRRPPLPSWILQRDGHVVDVDAQYTSVPSRIGNDFSLANLPIELKPYICGDIAKALGPMRDGLYPPELCLQVGPSQSSWMANLMIDPLYMHSVIFSVESFLDGYLHHRHRQSSMTQLHFLTTIQMLQDRLNDPAQLQVSASDSTIMTVIVLGLAAELIGDGPTAQAHMQGLAKMVHLRGGFDGLREENSRLPAKICRVDLCLALRFGHQPLFFRTAMPWDAFDSHQNLMGKASNNNNDAESLDFIKTKDKKLFRVWQNLVSFAHVCNLASQSTSKLPPNTFSELLISALYRLLSLSYPNDTTCEALRLGMISFATHVFFQWRGIRQRLDSFDAEFQDAVRRLAEQSSHNTMPAALFFWLVTLSGILSAGQEDTKLLQDIHRIIKQLKITSESDATCILKRAMWIDAIHTARLKKILEQLFLLNSMSNINST